MWTYCWATTMREANIQQPLMSNGFSNKHVPKETTEQQQKNGVLYAVRAQGL
jgi:hypothetical protein